jgi:hypothetical protein
MSSMIDPPQIVDYGSQAPRGAVRRFWARGLMLSLLAGLSVVGAASAQTATGNTDTPQAHPLASKEEMIRDRFQRLEDHIYRLRERIGETEPDTAQRLDRVLERAGELGLSEQLDEIIELLQDSSSWTDAVEQQAQWLADADRLLAILLERDSQNEERRAEIDRLEAYREQLNELLEQERRLRQAAGAAAAARRMSAQLGQALERINALLERQQQLSEQTAAAREDDSPQELADQQKGLSQDTAQLAEDLERLGADPLAESPDGPAQQAARPDVKAAADQAGEGAQAMQSASEQLSENDKGTAQRRQDEASDALRRARERLEEAKRRLDEAGQTEQTAQKQREVADATGNLSAQMQADAAGGETPGSPGQPTPQGAPDSPSPSTPQHLDQAQQEMDQAAESLNEATPEQAVPHQDRAIDQLEQAMRELQETLNQLRQEDREEALRDLESRFREMLAKQRSINEASRRLDEIGRDRFTRAEYLDLADLSARQRALSEEARTCVHILDEDGTTIVFPHVVGQIAEDMAVVADRLAASLVGALTRGIQQEIVEALEQLLESVQRMRQENEQQDVNPGQEDGSPSPLLPRSAELKLLRSSQLRVNKRTAAIETVREAEAESPDRLAEAARVVAERQQECADIAEQMRERLHEP